MSIVGIVVLCPKGEQTGSKRPFRERISELDYIGPLLFVPGVTCLLLALEWGGVKYPWNSSILIGLFCGFAVLSLIWVYSQYRLGKRATIPSQLFLQRTVLFASFYSFLFVGFQIVAYYLPLYFQAVKETTARSSSINILPIVITMIIAAAVGGFLITKTGHWVPFMIGGPTIASVGIGLMSTFGVNTTFSEWFGYQILAGIGIGVALQVRNPTPKHATNSETPFLAVQSVVTMEELPIATSITLFFSQTGASVFLTVAQTAFFGKLLTRMQAINPALSREDIIRAGATGLKELVAESQVSEMLAAYGVCLDAVFHVAAAITAAAVIMGFGVKWKRFKDVDKQEKECD